MLNEWKEQIFKMAKELKIESKIFHFGIFENCPKIQKFSGRVKLKKIYEILFKVRGKVNIKREIENLFQINENYGVEIEFEKFFLNKSYLKRNFYFTNFQELQPFLDTLKKCIKERKE